MKAIRVRQFGGPEVLKIEDVPDPVPDRNQVLVRVHAVGVNPYDTYQRNGGYGAGNPSLPWTPGADCAGVIEKIGPEVRGFSVGDRVFVSGTKTGAYAERALCTPDQLHQLPASLTFSQGAGIYTPYGTAYRALFQVAQARPGDSVLVHGASGGVGLAAVQFATAAGLTVLATAGSPAGLELLEKEGVRHRFNHKAPDYQRQILEATANRGLDIILEMLANVNLGNDLKLLATGGTVAVIGSRGDVQINPRELMTRRASVRGVFFGGMTERENVEINSALEAGLTNGRLVPRIGIELPLASAPEAHRRILEPGTKGKIVLLP